MLQKAIVLGLSILCLSVWTLVIFQLFQESPQVRATEAATRISALSQLPQLNDHDYTAGRVVVANNATAETSESDPIQINGLTKEDVIDIAINQSVSIDTLLTALNINR
ncbi:hypothetical protein [Bacillus sp. Marseille-P3661]|uniref:hypothetical protein n=1 Tax=Bacillus sp. Marseille-P3661 TaxID=1936234 RepID=UPI000C854F55|nr:hypothetical protein [Bacillus sp. Marseille-P3661]